MNNNTTPQRPTTFRRSNVEELIQDNAQAWEVYGSCPASMDAIAERANEVLGRWMTPNTPAFSLAYMERRQEHILETYLHRGDMPATTAEELLRWLAYFCVRQFLQDVEPIKAVPLFLSKLPNVQWCGRMGSHFTYAYHAPEGESEAYAIPLEEAPKFLAECRKAEAAQSY